MPWPAHCRPLPHLFSNKVPWYGEDCSSWGRVRLWGTKAFHTQSGIWAGRGQPLLVFTKMSSSEAVWLLMVTGANTAHAQTHSESLHQPPLFPALLTSGVRVLLLKGVKIRTWREWSQLKHDLRGFCSSNLGPTTPLKWCWTLSRREGLTVTWFSSTSISRATSYQGDSCQLTLGKDMTCVQLDPTLPPKPVGTYNLYRDIPMQGHHFKTAVADFSTSFHRDRES